MLKLAARLLILMIAAALASPQPSAAQLLGGGLGATLGTITSPLGRGAASVVDDVSRDTGRTLDAMLAEARRTAARRLILEHPEAIEADPHGAPVVRGEVLALSPSPQALEAARGAGFTLGPSIAEAELGLEGVTLIAPPGLSVREAVRRLQALDPAGRYDFDHIYQEGGVEAGPAAAGQSSVRRAADVRVGLVDGSVEASHPALRGVRVTQEAFAPGGSRVTAHATAVASLLAGSDGAFRGAAPGAQILVADVYGLTPAGGSAAAIVRGLGWLAKNQVGVVNVSLVGPPNLLLEAAVHGLVARGVLLVAAVGNDGPAAAPLYPAAYPGVVAVTAVDARRNVLPEAGRGPNLMFAAPGAQMAAATTGGGYAMVRGTSFAAPIVAGLLAKDLPAPDTVAAAAALRRLIGQAQDLGARGRDPVFGYGLVGFERRVDPVRVGARGTALRGP